MVLIIDEQAHDEFAQNADDKIDALINLLIKKKIITEEEFEKSFDDLFEN